MFPCAAPACHFHSKCHAIRDSQSDYISRVSQISFSRASCLTRTAVIRSHSDCRAPLGFSDNVIDFAGGERLVVFQTPIVSAISGCLLSSGGDVWLATPIRPCIAQRPAKLRHSGAHGFFNSRVATEGRDSYRH